MSYVTRIMYGGGRGLPRARPRADSTLGAATAPQSFLPGYCHGTECRLSIWGCFPKVQIRGLVLTAAKRVGANPTRSALWPAAETSVADSSQIRPIVHTKVRSVTDELICVRIWASWGPLPRATV